MGLHSRKSSRNNQLPKARISDRLLRNSATVSGPNAIVVSPKKRRIRLSAAIPFILSATAFGISLVLVLAGQKTGYMTDVHVMSVSDLISVILYICLTLDLESCLTFNLSVQHN